MSKVSTALTFLVCLLLSEYGVSEQTTIVDAKAAEAKPAHPKPTLVQMASKIYVVWGPDKVARLDLFDTGTITYKTDFKLRTSSCQFPLPEVECQISTQHQFRKITLVWAKNPDPTRVGKIVEVDERSTDAPDPDFQEVRDVVPFRLSQWEDNYLVSREEQKPYLSDRAKSLSGPEITCNRWDWLPKNSKSQILEASYELITESEDTGLSENRTQNVMNDLRYEISGNTMKVTSGQPFQSRSWYKSEAIVARAAGAASEIMGWTVESDDGRICSLTFDRSSSINQFATFLLGAETKRSPIQSDDLNKLKRDLEVGRFTFSQSSKNAQPQLSFEDTLLYEFWGLIRPDYTYDDKGNIKDLVLKTKEVR